LAHKTRQKVIRLIRQTASLFVKAVSQATVQATAKRRSYWSRISLDQKSDQSLANRTVAQRKVYIRDSNQFYLVNSGLFSLQTLSKDEQLSFPNYWEIRLCYTDTSLMMFRPDLVYH
jgi:hypothetical protein